MNKDKLKKHHFWILFGLVPLLVLIAVITISSGVGAAIEDRQAKIKKAQDDVSAKRGAKGNKLIEKMVKRAEDIANKRTELWEVNWKKQFPLFTWPKDSAGLLSRLDYDEKGQGLAFGDKAIPTANGELDVFRRKEVYLNEYAKMAERIAPTQFGSGAASAPAGGGGLLGGRPGAGLVGGGSTPRAGDGWQAVLRHVSEWGQQQPTPYQIWLALEDMWVQRAMIEAVRSVNEEISRFDPKPLAKADGGAAQEDPLHRRFVNRIWDVELWVDKVENKQVMKGKLTNNTDKLQLLGSGSSLILNVWLDENTAEPFKFKIGGEFVPGRGTMTIVPTVDHNIPPGTPVTKIAKVEQVFDGKTVPVRRVDKLVLGYPDARNAKVPPVKHTKFPDDPAAATGPEGGAALGPGPAPAGPGAGGRPGGAAPGGAGAGAQTTGIGNGWTVVSGGGTPEQVLDGTKKRYLDPGIGNGQLTPQVRRMPVATTLIVDQAFLEETLVAFTNSPLRMQITQVHWQRFRGTLNEQSGSSAAGGASGQGSDSPVMAGGGIFGGGLESGGRPGRPGPGSPGPGRPGGAFPGAAGPGPEGPGGYGGATVSEGQLNSGLIELTIYAVVSLYEKYQPPGTPAAGGPTTAPTTPPAKP